MQGEILTCGSCGRAYQKQGATLVAWPTHMHELSAEEAEHHDHDDGDARDVHQLERPRNVFYHTLLWQALRTLPPGSTILEIGAGTGFDAEQLRGAYVLTLSDVSPETLNRLAEQFADPKITYVAADGSCLPFGPNSFDAAYMVATLHHLPSPQQGVEECARVLSPGGLLAIGMEPNTLYFGPIKRFRGLLCSLTHMKPEEGSHADAEMEGFSYRELVSFFPRATWEDVAIRPAWLLAGFWHYGAEGIFRAFRLKKRLTLPRFCEQALVWLDELLFKVPGIRHLGWHWVIVARKR